MRPYDLALLFVLAALWGASFLFIRVTGPAFGPFALVAARVLLAAAALTIYAGATRNFPDLRTRWRQYTILGAVNAALPFTLIATAELKLTASLAAILNATTPLFTAVVAALWLRERLTTMRSLGLLLGLGGVAILVGWSPIRLDLVVLLAITASVGAAISYAVGGVYAAGAFRDAPPLELAICQQVAAGILMLPLAATHLPASVPSGGVVFAFLALSLFSTAVGYLMYFRLIASVGPTRTLLVTILVPVFGLLWGAIFLGEPVRRGTLAGMAVVLLSVALVAGPRLPSILAAPARLYAGVLARTRSR